MEENVKDALVVKVEEVENILKRMWLHDHDGSDLYPVPDKFWLVNKQGKATAFDWMKIAPVRESLKAQNINPNEHLLFDVMYREVFPLIDEIKKMIK